MANSISATIPETSPTSTNWYFLVGVPRVSITAKTRIAPGTSTVHIAALRPLWAANSRSVRYSEIARTPSSVASNRDWTTSSSVRAPATGARISSSSISPSEVTGSWSRIAGHSASMTSFV